MMGKNKVINLNSLGSTSRDFEEGFLREDKVKSIINMIEYRVEQIKTCKATNAKDEFNELRGHDSILIDGQRGSGKTTFLVNITKQGKYDIHFFDIIDPTLITIATSQAQTNSDILLMIVSRMYALVVDKIKKGDSEDEFEIQNILKKIKHINSTIINGYDIKKDMDYQERMYSLNDGLKLDVELHELFTLICKCIKKSVLVLPIDDIDMELDITFEILDVVRRYISSPRLIVVIALNSSQAYGLVKQHFFKTFELNTNTLVESIHTHADLDFIKGLPRAYMLKSFLPSRRIEMDDMVTLYRYYNDDIQDSKEPLVFSYTNRQGIQFHLDSKRLLRAFVNTVYGAYLEYDAHIKNSLDDYLEGLSMRSFISDMRNFLEAITHTDTNHYMIDKQSFRDNLMVRFLDYPRRHNSKKSALTRIWEEFIIQSESNRNIEADYGDPITKILQIDGHHIYNRYPKTYHRLWLQTYFMKPLSIDVKYNEDKKINDIHITKTFDIMGILELSLRSFIPMYIIQRYLSDNKELNNSKTKFLRSLVHKPLLELTNDLIRLERVLFNKPDSSDIKYFGRIDSLETVNITEAYEIILYDWYATDDVPFDKCSMSFIKSLVFFIDFSRFLSSNNIRKRDTSNKNIEDNKKIIKFFSNYLPFGYQMSTEIQNKLGDHIRMSSKLLLPELKAHDTSFDLVSIGSFSKWMVQNFFYIMSSIKKIQKKENHSNATGGKDITNKYYFSVYISSFLNALLIEFVESVKQNIPINKNYIHINQNWKYEEYPSTYSCPSIYHNLLFDNLITIQNSFEQEDSKTKDAVFSILIFVIRAIKYCGVWSNVFKRVYGYEDIFIAKKRNKITNSIESFKIFMVKDKKICFGFNDKIRDKGNTLKGITDNERDIELDKYCHDELFKDIEIKKNI